MLDRTADLTTHAPDRRSGTDGRRPEPRAATSAGARATFRLWRHLVVTAGAVALVAALFPRLIGASWGEIAASTQAIPLPLVGLLIVTWAAGLAAHTVTLTSALPGLSHPRALLLSLTGSAVANVLPLGGAAGIAVNERMTRRWGFPRTSFAAYTVITNVWDVFAKMFLPLLLIPMVMDGGALSRHTLHLAGIAAAALAVIGGATAVLVFGPVLPRLVRRLDAGAERSPGRWRARLSTAIRACEDVRRHSSRVAALRWRRLSTGMILYTSLLFALLLLCLGASGAGIPVGYALLAFCAERCLTLIGLTPGAIGFVEVGLAGLLMTAPTADGPGVAVGVLLYRLLTFGIEIPVGGALLALWLWRTGRVKDADRVPSIGTAG